MHAITSLIEFWSHLFTSLLIVLSVYIPALAPQAVPVPPPATTTSTSTQPSSSSEEPQRDSTHGLVEPTGTATRGPAAEPAEVTPPTKPTTPAKPQKSQEEVNEIARAALVNILCTTASGGYLAPISGSGVVVDSRGVILTNAHVGQFFLLRDYGVKDNVQCVVRTGSPATPKYTAELLYLPPTWIEANASQLVASQAHGTGEYDYAFLRITGTTNPQGTLPASFPTVPMSTSYPAIGDEMLLAAYPAGFLGGESITKALYASSALAYTTQLFSFDDNTKKVDLFSIGGTVLSQAGSSGGVAMRMDGTLAGIIATATIGNSTETRDLRALSLSHIDLTLHTFGQGGINGLLAGDLAAKSATFDTTTAPSERATLYNVLDGQ